MFAICSWSSVHFKYGPRASGGTTNFFVGGIKGEKCNSEGGESKNLLKMADFGHFFLLMGGQVGAEPLMGGGGQIVLHAPLDAATDKSILDLQYSVLELGRNSILKFKLIILISINNSEEGSTKNSKGIVCQKSCQC